jgi:D-alanyl-D-alanine carboxypeptidase
MTAITPERLHEVLDKARTTFGASAAGAALVTANGDIRVAVSGTRKPGGDPVLDTDRWHIGSTFKAINALVWARLVEQGRAEWGVPVDALFPDLAAGAAPGWNKPTIDEVFTCQSGMRGNPSLHDLLAGFKDTRPLIEQRTDATIKALSEAPKNRGRFVYSNLGYTIVGAAVDRLTGKPFEEVVAEEVFKPLGVTSAGWGPPPEIWGRGGRIMLNGLIAGRGKPADPTDLRSDNPPLINPAGRLHLSLGDWAKIQRVFISGGGGIVTPESLEHLFAVPEGNPMCMGWARARATSVAFRSQQGSNGRWVATAHIATDRSHTAMLIVNDGRTRTLTRSAKITAELLG